MRATTDTDDDNRRHLSAPRLGSMKLMEFLPTRDHAIKNPTNDATQTRPPSCLYLGALPVNLPVKREAKPVPNANKVWTCSACA